MDVKPISKWFQVHDGVQHLRLDLREKEACETACQGANEIYNLACDMGGMGFIERNKARCMLSVLINTGLLLAARAQDAERHFFASSACVYNSELQRTADGPALREEDAYPAMPEDGYGWEKLFSERMCTNFGEDFGLETRNARFHNVYGPMGAWSGGREGATESSSRDAAPKRSAPRTR